MPFEPGKSRETAESFPGAVLTLVEAAWAAGLSRTELQALIRAGKLSVRRVVRAGRVVSVVPLAELERAHQQHESTGVAQRAETARLRERVAGLEGELTASDRVERSLQRYADRLEERSHARILELEAGLSEARKREMTLARALGQAEARATQLAANVEASERVSELEAR